MMSANKKVYLIPNPFTPGNAVVLNADICNGCNACVEQCRTDVLFPNSEKGMSPIIMYPDECWFCGCCVEDCPNPGAITMEHPLNQRVGWKRKKTGEYFRIGMKNPPSPNLRPPVS